MSGEMVKDWQLYLAGKRYNERLSPNYYDTINANLDFFAGNQWRNSEADGLMKPVFNIIKRITTFFVASLTSSAVSVQFEPLAFTDMDEDPNVQGADIAMAEVENIFEKINMDNRIRDALFQTGIKGDVAGHWYFDPTKKPYRGKLGHDVQGEICFELVSGANVFFGNANNTDVDLQPYIIISGRDMVDSLREEAEFHRKSKDVVEINEDNDFNDESGEGGQIEVDADEYGKATYIIIYRKDKKTGTIKMSKAVQNAYIYEDVETELEYYPVSWLVWEKQENQYHGRALITGIIANQIFINKMFAMVMYNLMMTAFPKAVYNADWIESWSNQIGESIGVNGLAPNENIRNLAGYLESGNMSDQITPVIEMAMSYTKETLGISDVAMGNVKPNNTSAIIAVQKSTVIPLENIRANLYEWMEDNAKILLDMMGTYYGVRPIVREQEQIDPMTGQSVTRKGIELFDFNTFKDLWLQIRVDVGEATYWSEIASLETLDNLLLNQQIDIVDYLERIPEGYIPQRQELINKIKERMEAQQEQGVMQQQQESQYEQMAQFIESLPDDIQARLEQIRQSDPEGYEQAVMQLMQESQAA